MWSAVSLIVLVQVYLSGAVFEVTQDRESNLIFEYSPGSHGTNLPTLQARRPDYIYTPNVGAHKLITQRSDWNTARETCDQDGAHLVIINSVAEAEVVGRLLNLTNSRSSHVGVHDLYREGQFVTIHGEALIRAGFTEWRDGEPNNQSSNGYSENCVEIRSSAKLNDIRCTNYRTMFVCELH